MADDNKPSDQAAAPGAIAFATSKRYEVDEDHGSRVRPAYVNQFDLVRIGLDVFLDACIMPMDDIIGASTTGSVEVIVLDRYVMNLETFTRLHASVNQLHQQLTDGKALPIDATLSFDSKK